MPLTSHDQYGVVMTRARNKRRQRAADGHALTVVVCRGGDCGSRAKHPGVDHVGLLRETRELVGRSAQVAPSKCLDACEHSNVVVVVPAAAASEGEPVWIGDVNDSDVNAALCEYVRSGGPGIADLPIELELRQFRATRRNRDELDVETSITDA